MGELALRKRAAVGVSVLLMALGAGAPVASAFTNYQAAAVDQYGNGGNLGANGNGNPGANGGKGGGHGQGKPGNAGSQGQSGAGNAGSQGQSGSGSGSSSSQLPFTGLNLMTLVVIALLLAAAGLLAQATQRGLRGHRIRTRN